MATQRAAGIGRRRRVYARSMTITRRPVRESGSASVSRSRGRTGSGAGMCRGSGSQRGRSRRGRGVCGCIVFKHSRARRPSGLTRSSGPAAPAAPSPAHEHMGYVPGTGVYTFNGIRARPRLCGHATRRNLRRCQSARRRRAADVATAAELYRAAGAAIARRDAAIDAAVGSHAAALPPPAPPTLLMPPSLPSPQPYCPPCCRRQL